MIFLPKEHASRLACEQEMERAIKAEGQVLLGWRDVPVNRDMPMSPNVRAKEPVLRQVFIGRGNDVIVQDALERKLYVIRKTASANIQRLKLKHSKEYYVPSMSSRTVIYKGLLLADQVGTYYLDLQDPRCVSALGLVHQRFSTNTFPEWPLAHPYRYIAHNGEINTVKGNYNWMKAREGVMSSPVLGADLQKLYPISFADQSDTATFDNCLELLTMAGYPISQAVMMMIPEPWEQHTTMDERRKAFYEYHAAMMEPWDGPASIVFTDGRQIGATLDRNGLRPARYCITDDDLVIMGSEAGVLPVPENKIVRKWRLQPGKMFLIDLEQGRMIDDEELKANLANSKPYKQWIENLRIRLDDLEEDGEPASASESTVSLLDRQQAFGTTQEDIKFLMAPMAQAGEEAIGSMGNDSPLAVLSDRNKPLYNYFKQLFAQVTNPPIDPIREAIVMSLVSFIGPKPNLLDINQVNPPMRLEVSQPILDFADMAKLRDIERTPTASSAAYTLDITYPLAWGQKGVEAKLASLCAEAVDAIKGGKNILIISDRAVSATQVAIPALLACRPSTSTWCAKACAPPPVWWWKPARRARCTTLVCWRATAPKPCTPTWRWKRWPAIHKDLPATCRREGHLQLRQGGRQGPVQDHVQDGREHLHELLRRAAVRGHWPEQRHRGQVLHRHAQPGRRHRRVRDRRRSHPHAQGGVW
jgi:glutamate synthase (NADPH/NADH) large chain